MKLYTYILLLLLLLPLNFYGKADWELIKDKKGIEIYTKKGNSTEYIEIKGVSEVRSNLKAFVALMKDVNGFKDWMHSAKETSLIKKNNDYHFSYYLRSDIPWPGRDRDVALDFRILRDSENQTVYTKASDLKGVIPEKDGIRRIPSVKSSWRFVALNGNQVRIIFKTKVKPNIQLPGWLIERIFNKGPYHTIKNMKQMVQKEKYQSARIDLTDI